MKSIGPVALVLLAAGASYAAAQLAEGPPARRSEEAKPIDLRPIFGMLRELKVGQAVVWRDSNRIYSDKTLRILRQPRDEAVAAYRTRMDARRTELEEKVSAAKAEVKTFWEKRPKVATNDEINEETKEQIKAWSEEYSDLKDKAESLQRLQHSLPDPQEVWEITDIQADYLVLSSPKGTRYVLPERMIDGLQLDGPEDEF